MNTASIQEPAPPATVEPVRPLALRADALSMLSGIYFSLGFWLSTSVVSSQSSLLGSLLMAALPLARSCSRAVARRMRRRPLHSTNPTPCRRTA